MDKDISNGQLGNFVDYDVKIENGEAIISLKIKSVELVASLENKVPGAVGHALLEAAKGFLIK